MANHPGALGGSPGVGCHPKHPHPAHPVRSKFLGCVFLRNFQRVFGLYLPPHAPPGQAPGERSVLLPKTHNLAETAHPSEPWAGSYGLKRFFGPAAQQARQGGGCGRCPGPRTEGLSALGCSGDVKGWGRALGLFEQLGWVGPASLTACILQKRKGWEGVGAGAPGPHLFKNVTRQGCRARRAEQLWYCKNFAIRGPQGVL